VLLIILAVKKNNNCMLKANIKIGLIILVAGLYAIVRYHVFGPVLWRDLPVFTFNKILIFSVLILWSLKGHQFFKLVEKPLVLNLIKIFVALHILLSQIVLKPYYLKSFFADDSLSLSGNLSVWAGAMAAAVFFGGKLIQLSQALRFLLLTGFIALHLIFMGGASWLQPQTWYGGMPPITLISFVLVVYVAVRQIRVNNNI